MRTITIMCAVAVAGAAVAYWAPNLLKLETKRALAKEAPQLHGLSYAPAANLPSSEHGNAH